MINWENVLLLLPQFYSKETYRICKSRKKDGSEISEIRLRAKGRSSFILSGERIYFSSSPTEDEIKKTLSRICDGALYAYRDSIKEGYITLDGGIRVGICGQARYEDSSFIGVSEATSLVFRIPTGASSFTNLLYELWKKTSCGMLIYSPPGVGKTTAVRSLVKAIGSGSDAEQVAVIDERCEFSAVDYSGSSVDVFKGYKRAEGISIALRSMSPDVIAVDEIGRLGEAEAMRESLNSGVRIIATVHASSFSELKRKINMRPFFDGEVFDVFVGLSMKNGKRCAEVERLKY